MRKIITTAAGELIDFDTVFEESLTLGDTPPADKVGRVEKVEYTTDVYEDGVTYPKYCLVYLPYCYDPEDKDRRYNVLYYQHGNTCEPEIFAYPENQKFFDNLFASGEIEPCIIVSTTYYFDIEKDREERKRSGMVPAGDGGWPGVKGNFWREVIEDILPAVEMRYNTYLTDPSPEGLRAARDHRAFSGYSRGSVATWRVFHYAFEYFRWYAPMSCHTTADHSIREPVPMEEVLEYLQKPVCEHPELPFYIYASNGYPHDFAVMTEQMKHLTKADGFSFGTDPSENNIYFSISNFYHSDILVPQYYYNSLKVLFHL